MTGASISFRTILAHVPGEYPSASIVNLAAVRTCARLRWRAHSGIKNAQPRQPPSSTAGLSPVSVIVTCLPRWRNWRTAIEHTPTRALAVRRLLPRRGNMLSGFCNLFGALSARSSFFRSLDQDANQPSSRVIRMFVFAPVLSSLTAHGNNHAAGAVGNAQISFGEVRNVVR